MYSTGIDHIRLQLGLTDPIFVFVYLWGHGAVNKLSTMLESTDSTLVPVIFHK